MDAHPVADTGTALPHAFTKTTVPASLQASLAAEFKARQPADIEQECRQFIQQTALTCIELGKRLCFLKSLVAHGEWLSTLERIGIGQRLAQSMMRAAIRFLSNSGGLRIVEAAKSKSKLLELLVLDDEEVEAMALGGEVRGITIDALPGMTVAKLRDTLKDITHVQAETKSQNQADQVSKCFVDETSAVPLQPGDRIRSIHAHRAGLVVRVYDDCSAAVHWDDAEPQPFGFAHERMPRHLLELVKRPDPAAAKARRKDYCRELCRMVARYADDAETLELARALEDVSARILARRYCPGLNAAAYEVFARYGMKDALTRFAVEGGAQ